MVTDMITLKLDDSFLKKIDAVVKAEGYQNRTEFIRNAVREKVEQVTLKDNLARLTALRGAGKREKQTTNEEMELIREQVSKEFDLKFK